MPRKPPFAPGRSTEPVTPEQRWQIAVIHSETASGLALGIAGFAAMLWANSPWHASYASLWHLPLSVPGAANAVGDLRSWVNDALMTLFFLVVGEELGREWREGDLRSLRSALFPLIGALGGMVGAAAVYLLAAAGAHQARGWGVPMATDIAFALSALALLGRAAPAGLRLFLLALAIADDVGSIISLAAFYSSHIAIVWLAGAMLLYAATAAMRRWVTAATPYLLAAVGLWIMLARAGVEPALAGAAIGFLMPARDGRSRFWSVSHLLSRFAVLPIFALANAGFAVQANLLSTRDGAANVLAGVAAGRVFGKLAGVLLFCWIAERLGLARRPRDVSWLQMAGGAAIAGVGFTVPLLFADAAFAGHADALHSAIAGLYLGSIAAFATGAAILLLAARQRSAPARNPVPRTE